MVIRLFCLGEVYYMTFELDLDLEHVLGTILFKFGRDPAICLAEEVICAHAYRRMDG